ncbi:MAG: type II toxin-antitoxin system RelE/ParE family toxin [Pseudomonadota bacterium]
MSYWLHDEAERELGDAAVYYAEHATPKIAVAFLAEFERVVELLQLNQQLGTRKEEGMRSYPFQRFPYSLVYREDSKAGPQVYAVAHQSREPGYWQGRQ